MWPKIHSSRVLRSYVLNTFSRIPVTSHKNMNNVFRLVNPMYGATTDNQAHLLEVFGEVGDGAPLAGVKEHLKKFYEYYYYYYYYCYE